jgi:uncharacterized protein (TIGR00369 family)
VDLELLKKVAEEYIPFNRFLGVQATRMERGLARLELPFREEFVGDWMRPALHGGVISMLADTAGGMAVWTALEKAPSRVSTIDLRVDYLRPGKPERLIAEGTVVRAGRTVGVADIRLFHPGAEGEVVATGKGVYAIKVLKQHPE